MNIFTLIDTIGVLDRTFTLHNQGKGSLKSLNAHLLIFLVVTFCGAGGLKVDAEDVHPANSCIKIESDVARLECFDKAFSTLQRDVSFTQSDLEKLEEFGKFSKWRSNYGISISGCEIAWRSFGVDGMDNSWRLEVDLNAEKINLLESSVRKNKYREWRYRISMLSGNYATTRLIDNGIREDAEKKATVWLRIGENEFEVREAAMLIEKLAASCRRM